MSGILLGAGKENFMKDNTNIEQVNKSTIYPVNGAVRSPLQLPIDQDYIRYNLHHVCIGD